jgi:hypothetical protein
MGLFRRREPKRDRFAESIERAVPASATVIGARPVTQAVDGVGSTSEVYEVELDVDRDGHGRTRQTVRWTVFDVAVPDVRPGQLLAVTVDPDRPAVVYPPGYPPPNMRPGVIALADARILPTSGWLDDALT